MSVDWAAVDRKIPTASTPAGQALRKELFDGMDPNGNGLLSLTEVNGGLPSMVSGLIPTRDYRPAIKIAFKVAREINEVKGNKKSKKAKEENDMVDRSEFHGLLVAFRQLIELDVMFDSIDSSGDRKLSWKEVEKALPKLADWNLGAKSAVKKKFPDDWTESMKFDDFAEWCVNRKMGGFHLKLDENDAFETLQADVGGTDAGKLLKAFENWDADGSGSISEDEMFTVLVSLDPTFTQDMAKELFKAADQNSDGVIDYKEFAQWIVQ